MNRTQIFTAVLILLAFSQLKAQEHSNEVGLFLGATGELTHGGTGFTIGVEYEHIFLETSPEIGLGFIGEMAFAEHSEYLFGLPVYFHPMEDLKLLAAPMYQMIDIKEDEEIDELHEMSKNNVLLRVGAAYTLHFDNIGISPSFNIDLGRKEYYMIYGVTASIGF